MAECSDILALLSAFHDGELDPHQMYEVARHLPGCPQCESALSDYDTLGRDLRDTTPTIDLEGFSAAVLDRIERLQPGPFGRIIRWFARIDERTTAGLSLASAAVAVAALTALILTPYASRWTSAGATRNAVIVARAPAANPVPGPGKTLAQATESPTNVVPANSRTIISSLEAQNPAVAVWSEPRDDTTVIWLPDQQQ